MKIMRLISIWVLCFVSFQIFATPQGEGSTFIVEGKEYTISEVLPVQDLNLITSIAYSDGHLFLSNTNGDPFALPVPVDGGTVSQSDMIPLVVRFDDGVSHESPYPFYYIGESTEGELFSASYATTDNKTFELFLLVPDIAKKELTAVKKWELPAGDTEVWLPRNPHVKGGIKTGNFSVSAQIWRSQKYTKGQIDDWFTTVACWKVTDDEISEPFWANAALSGSMIKPLGSNRVLVHDKQHWSKFKGSFDLPSRPFVAQVNEDHSLVVESTLALQCEELNPHGCGAVVFSHSNASFLAYHKGTGESSNPDAHSPKIGLAYLLNGDEDLSKATPVASIMTLDNVDEDSWQDDEHITHIHASPIDSNTTLLYTYHPSHQVLGIYTLSTEPEENPSEGTGDDDIGTGVSEVRVGYTPTPEYFDLYGRRTHTPTEAGMYILKTGSKVEKILIK